MNTRFARFPVLALVFALLATLTPAAFAQPDQFSSSAILRLNLEDIASRTASSNDAAKRKYELEFANYLRNVEVDKSLGKVTPVPAPPTIRIFDAKSFSDAFTAYVENCAMNAPIGKPCGEFDFSSAFTLQPFPALTAPAPTPPPSQPDNPIGASMGAGYYAAAPGDTHPDGYVYTNPLGVSFRKYVVETPFGKRSWYQVVESAASRSQAFLPTQKDKKLKVRDLLWRKTEPKKLALVRL